LYLSEKGTQKWGRQPTFSNAAKGATRRMLTGKIYPDGGPKAAALGAFVEWIFRRTEVEGRGKKTAERRPAANIFNALLANKLTQVLHCVRTFIHSFSPFHASRKVFFTKKSTGAVRKKRLISRLFQLRFLLKSRCRYLFSRVVFITAKQAPLAAAVAYIFAAQVCNLHDYFI
jgi:hypothetical protein